ncbi:MAG: winged helix-turn-helix domain-containing protein, partial [Gammaproteobacteria bacterium]|nr:winged helix-turn-helix domain-containing protein [Gammaproteobacteria bacterium]
MRYQFDEYVLDTDCFELTRQGTAIKTEPQVIELLAFLIVNCGRLVSKEEINKAVWKGRFVSESALSSRIKSARQILGDDGKTQQYIKTIHKKGFRFVGNVLEETSPPTHFVPSAPLTHHEESLTRKLEKARVAVLPFSNLSNDEEQEYLCDGITSDIITNLTKHRWLQVTARNTSFGYKGKSVNARILGEELDVEYVVEGSIQRAGNRVRVIANLIDTQNGSHIWSDRLNGNMEDIFALQDEITEKIVARVEPEIGFAERNRVVGSRPANLAAWDCYHLGIYHFFKFTGNDNLEAQRLLARSQELDNTFGEAYAWWAYAVILGMVYWETKPTQEMMDQALEACDKALDLDPKNASFHALKARVLLARCEYDAALIENEIAISLNPTFAAAHCGLGDSLAYEGRYEESLACFERAVELSPNDPQLWAFLTYGALALLFKHEFDKALSWTEKAATIPNCQYWTMAHKIVALVYLNRLDEAKETVCVLLKQKPNFSLSFAKEKLFYL